MLILFFVDRQIICRNNRKSVVFAAELGKT